MPIPAVHGFWPNCHVSWTMNCLFWNQDEFGGRIPLLTLPFWAEVVWCYVKLYGLIHLKWVPTTKHVCWLMNDFITRFPTCFVGRLRRPFKFRNFAILFNIPYQWIISQLPTMDQPKQLVDKPEITGQWFNGCFWFWEHPDGFHGHLNHTWWWG